MSTKCNEYVGEGWIVNTDYDDPGLVFIDWNVKLKGCSQCGHNHGQVVEHGTELPLWVWKKLVAKIRASDPKAWEEEVE